MGDKMSAVVVSDTEQLARNSSNLPVSANIYFVQAAQIEAQTNGSLPALAQYVKSKDQVVESMLGGVYTADNLEQALTLRSQLCTTECLVTPKGALVGSNWYSPVAGNDAQAGVMETTRMIQKFESQVKRNELHLQTKRQKVEKTRKAIAELESTIAHLRGKLTENNAQISSASGELGEIRTSRIRSSEIRVQLQSQIEQLKQNTVRLRTEQQELQRQADIDSNTCNEIEHQKSRKLQQLRQAQTELKELQDAVNDALALKHQIELGAQKFDSDQELVRSSIADHKQRLNLSLIHI